MYKLIIVGVKVVSVVRRVDMGLGWPYLRPAPAPPIIYTHVM